VATYLIRHTTPQVAPGTCYGQTDLPLADTFEAEGAALKAQVPPAPRLVYSSPLSRCRRLAAYLWPGAAITTADALKELDFGDWENRPWAELEGLEAWMNDFVERKTPHGESYRDLHRRVTQWWLETATDGCVIVTHASVIRSLLCHLYGTPLENSFQDYPVAYGQVYRLGPGAANAEKL